MASDDWRTPEFIERQRHHALHGFGPCTEPPCPLPIRQAQAPQPTPGRLALKRPDVKLRHELGGDWILDAPADAEPVWGVGQQILWPRGESLLLVGGIGTGKTTIGQQAVLHGIGALEGPFLGYPVALRGVVGYVAADRPAQIRRSFRRMVDEDMRDLVNDRLDVWSGALPFALDGARTETGELADFVQDRGWDALVLDSLKDLVTGTTDDDSGLRINQQIQECTARGIEVLALHHQRKSSEGNRKPNKLDDVYGSRWITAGAGSVLMLWAEAGSASVQMSHLKQPAETIGPLMLLHDHAVGRTTVEGMAEIRMPGKADKGEILAMLPATTAEIMRATGLSRTTVSSAITVYRREGLVQEKPGRRGNEAPIWDLPDG